MLYRSSLVALSICLAANAWGQISGRFYLEKSTFAAGEPIFLSFEVTNDGTETVNIFQADPYSFCSGYQVKVTGGPTRSSSCSPYGFAGSCLSSDTPLASGAKHTERLLLNYANDLNAPGDYSVEASRSLPNASAKMEYFAATKDKLDVGDTLHFTVDKNLALDSKAYQPWIEQLRWSDPGKRQEAARVLASLAPVQLEDLLLGFAGSNEVGQFAPLAFRRLNTPRSYEALADLVKNAQTGSYESLESARYLAQSGDQKWFPLLQEVGVKNAQISNYVDAAATLGGEKMLPTLISLSNSPDRQFVAVNAVTAIGSTGSRAAMPILLEFLRNPDSDIADRARYALRLLTHRAVSMDNSDSPQSEHPRWSQWWAREGGSAPIYRPDDCGEVTPLT